MQGPGGEDTKFVYDGEDAVADDDGGTLTKYQNGPGIDNKLRVQTGSDVKYFLSDHLGSTNGLADPTGAVTTSTGYDSFGNATKASFPSRYQFTGREYDGFSGFYYYRARWYDSRSGRFISEDPIGFKGRNVNLYGYVNNGPLNRRDPTGLVDMGWGSPTGPPAPYSHLRSNDPCECKSSPGTFQIGFAASGVLGVVPLTGSAGLALDTSGDLGLYYDGGTGAGLGADLTGGLQITVTNASNIKALEGSFVNPTASVGEGVAASGSLVYGHEDSGPTTGGSLLIGGGGGGAYSVTVTQTTVIPLVNIPELMGGKRCARK